MRKISFVPASILVAALIAVALPAQAGPDVLDLSRMGNETLTCHCEACTDAPPQVVKGFLCGMVFSGLTTNSQLVVDDYGNIMLRCQVKAKG